ncbi:MAG: malectin domain-containing carbohydrate-binding protein [Planctomycetota bacterium]
MYRSLAFVALFLTLAAAPAETVWQESGGVLIMEAEKGTAVNTPTWDVVTDYDGYKGTGFIRWEGSNKYNNNSYGRLSYTFDIVTPGTYHVRFRAQAKGPDYGKRNDECNDCWIQKSIGSNDFYKFHVGNKSTADWHFNMMYEDGHDHRRLKYDLSDGRHTLTIAARSEKFMIDRIYLVQDTNDLDETLDESSIVSGVSVGGTLKQWHRVDLAVNAVESSQSADPNPFRDYRFNVTFTSPGGDDLVVPGYFAGDGAGGAAGDVWMAHLNPHQTGTWTYSLSFRSGADVAVDLDAEAGSPVTPFDGMSGSFTVGASDKSGDDFRAPEKGMLVNSGHHYLTYGGGGQPFVYTGPGIPENLLGYRGFTNTTIGIGHDFTVHESDWNSGDPDWNGGDGRALIGALNYIAEQGGNAIYMMSNTIGGDGEDCFPHPTSEDDKDRYDLLKLQQWDIALAHAQARGIFLNWHLAEHESANMSYYGASLSVERRLYFRMLNARFGHYNGLKWNLMEECEWNADERAEQMAYIKAVDPYDHPCTYQVGGIGIKYDTYTAHYGDPNIDAGSFQGSASRNSMFNTVQNYREDSAAGGEPWTIAWDEPQKIENDNTDEAKGYPMGRRDKMWPCLMAGGDGFMWYIQKDGGGHGFDQRIEDFTIMQNAFNWCGYARDFLEPLPLLEMEASTSIVDSSTGNDYTLYKLGVVYAIFNDRAGTGMTLDLTGASGSFTVRWFDPRNGGGLQSGSVATVSGGAPVDLGSAPSATDQDWACLVQRISGENTAPSVDAGSDQAIIRGSDAALDGTVSDDGLPDGSLDQTWSVISEPGTTAIADPTAVDTSASFTGIGTRLFRLEASDGDLSSSDIVGVGVYPAASDVALAINAGGEAYTSSTGIAYAADTGVTGGSTYEGSDPVDGTTEQALYTTERYGDFAYALAVADGDYLLTLQLAEIYQQSDNQRVFDVVVEGVTAIDDCDIHAHVGHDRPYDITLPVSIVDGQLDVQFSSEKGNAKLAALLLTRDGSAPLERAISIGMTRDGAVQSIEPQLDPADDAAPSEDGGIWTFDGLQPITDYRITFPQAPNGSG